MNFNFVDAIKGVLKSTAEETLLMKTLIGLNDRLREVHIKTEMAMDNMSAGPWNNVRGAIESATPILNGVDAPFWRELDSANSCLAVMRSNALGLFQTDLDVVVKEFESMMKMYNLDRKPSNALQAMLVATTLLVGFLKVREVAAALRKVLIDPLPHREQEATLHIFFDGTQDAAQLSRSINCLDSIYNGISQAMGIDTDEYPLRITRVLVGSTWVDVVGKVLAIPLVISVLRAMGHCLYRLHTQEGQIEGAPLRIELAKRVGKLLEDARGKGIATPAMETAAQDVYQTVVENTLELLKNEQRINIDGEDLIIRDPIYATALMDAQRAPALPPGKSGSPPHLPAASGEPC